MQPPTAVPRDAFTSAQITALLQDASALTVAAGCELVDQGLAVLEDITDSLVSGSVSRNGYATLHGTATLELDRLLDWGSTLVRPYMTITDGVISARFNLGVYGTSMPSVTHGRTPYRYQVQGFDVLHLLNDPVGDAYAVAAGTGYLTAVENVLTGRGFTRYAIDQQSAASVLPLARTWPLDERTTWLTVVNDLLGSIGYQGIWSDWDGRLRVQAYDPPRERAAEWYYDTGQYTSMMGVERTVHQDWYFAPNRWVAVQSNAADQSTPVFGNGVYIYLNSDFGPTSVSARNGRVVTRFLSIDAADHASLVAKAQVSIDADIRLPTTIEATTAPNPMHWHFDRLVLDDPAMGPVIDAVSTEWTLPLNGDDMTHLWSVL